MDLTNKTDNLEHLRMFNPCDKKSQERVGDIIYYMNFYLPVYPQHIWEELEKQVAKGIIRAPRCIFLPEKALMKQMIMANIKFAGKDKE
jgi:hypothetical protein